MTVHRDAARETPNLRATQVELYDGLEAHSQNRWPNLRFDLGRANDFLSPIFPAGFYYKTFMWPRAAWAALYEPLIRRAAGLGRAPSQPDPDRYTQRFAHCDVLVVGGGPAGLAAALAAAAGGARVISATSSRSRRLAARGCAASIDGEMADAWLAWSLAELAGNPRVCVMPRTTAFGYFPHNKLGLVERLTDHLADPPEGRARERLWQVRAREVVLATGAIERPLVFPGNDRPGRDAGRRRAKLPRPLWRACRHAGGRRDGDRRRLRDGARAREGRHRDRGDRGPAREGGGRRCQCRARRGHRGPRGRHSPRHAAAGFAYPASTSKARRLACDLVLMSGGFDSRGAPLLAVARPAQLERRGACLRASVAAERAHPAGAGRGVYGLSAALADGAAAGLAAARASGHPAPAMRFDVSGGERQPDAAGVKPPVGAGPKAFVDFQNDVTARDLALAMREGFRSIEHVKRYTTTGMATDQGKTSSLNALGIIAAELGKAVPEVGHTTFRMPYTPVSFGSLAGLARGDAVRSRAHDTHARVGRATRRSVRGCRPVEACALLSAAGEDMHAAVARECRAVRNGAASSTPRHSARSRWSGPTPRNS